MVNLRRSADGVSILTFMMSNQVNTCGLRRSTGWRIIDDAADCRASGATAETAPVNRCRSRDYPRSMNGLGFGGRKTYTPRRNPALRRGHFFGNSEAAKGVPGRTQSVDQQINSRETLLDERSKNYFARVDFKPALHPVGSLDLGLYRDRLWAGVGAHRTSRGPGAQVDDRRSRRGLHRFDGLP